jgi:hypothetical protein
MLMTFKSAPLTAKNRASLAIQRNHESEAQAAFIKARIALMAALGVAA